MKKMYFPLLLAGLLAASTACDNTIKTDDAQVSEAKDVANVTNADATLKVDTAESEMTWVGAKVTGRHPGTFDIKEGTIQLKDGKIAGGKFVFDMTTLRSTDKNQGDEENKKLTTHLRSPDFFDVEKYPEATFVIVSVKPADKTGTDVNLNPESSLPDDHYNEYRITETTHTVTGNLTLKDVTKSITFPAKVEVSGDKATAKANFNIDRTDWQLTYGADKSLGNKFIYSAVNLGFDIVAKP